MIIKHFCKINWTNKCNLRHILTKSKNKLMEFLIYNKNKAKRALLKCPVSKDIRILNCKFCKSCVAPAKYFGNISYLEECYEKIECPFDALVFEDKLLKCDFCRINNFVPICLGKGILLKYSSEEENYIGDNIGWVINPSKINEVIEDSNEYIIYKNTSIHFYPKLFKPFLYEIPIIKDVRKTYIECKENFSYEELLDELYELPKITKDRILEILDLTYNKGILSILDYDFFEEISMNSLKSELLGYHCEFGWIYIDLKIWTEEYFMELMNKYSTSINRKFSLDSPRLNAVLPNGDRLYCAAPPISKTHIFTIRKFKKRVITIDDFLRQKVFDNIFVEIIKKLVNIDSNIIICGNTGAGKTTLLNAILNLIKNPLERIVIVEETPEIQINSLHKVNLIANISMRELILDTLRLRPDKIIVGEVRSQEEIRALFDAMLAGQGKGVYTTMHALSSKECIQRILNAGVYKEDLNAIDLIIVLRRYSIGNKDIRKVIEVSEYNNGIKILGEYDFEKNKWVWNLKNSKLIKKLEIYKHLTNV